MRKYKRKTVRAERTTEAIQNAVHAHLVEKKSLAETALLFNIPKRSLARYCKKARNATPATVVRTTPAVAAIPTVAATPSSTIVPTGVTKRIYPNPGQVSTTRLLTSPIHFCSYGSP